MSTSWMGKSTAKWLGWGKKTVLTIKTKGNIHLRSFKMGQNNLMKKATKKKETKKKETKKKETKKKATKKKATKKKETKKKETKKKETKKTTKK